MVWAPNYATTAELAAYLRIADSVDDVQLGLALAGASRAVDQTCRRQFGALASPADRYYTAGFDSFAGKQVVTIDDLGSAVGLVVATDLAGDGTYSTVLAAPVLGPRNAAADGLPWTQLRASTGAFSSARDAVRVTGLWGWTAVPDAVKQATLLQASRLLARRDSPFGVAGSVEEGSQVRLLSRVDPDVAVLLRPYMLRWYAA